MAFPPLPESTNTSSPVAAVGLQPILQITQTAAQPAPLDPQPTRTSTQPAIPSNTPAPQLPSPTDFVLSYWQNVSEGRYESAWVQLSPRFQQATHDSNYNDYVNGYEQMNLCRIVVSNVNLIKQDSYSAVVMAHLTYYVGSQCRSSEYNFEMWFVYDDAGNAWLFDRNIKK